MEIVNLLLKNIWLLELIGTIFMLLGVWLTTQQNKWNWWVSIAGLLIYIFIFFQSKLYADAALQGIYILLSIYGWYQWQHSNQSDILRVIAASKQQHFYFFSSGIVGGIVIFCLLKNYTNSDLPFLDAFTTSYSLVATYMMAKKILHCWWYWVIIDIVYVAMYVYKDLKVTALQYFIFTLLAIYGYMQWRSNMKKI